MEGEKQQLSVPQDDPYLAAAKDVYYAWISDRTAGLDPCPQEVILENYPWANKREENGFERLCLEFFSSSPDVELVIFAFNIVSTILAELMLNLEEDEEFKPKDADVIGSFQRLLNAYKSTMLQYDSSIAFFNSQRVLKQAEKKD